MEDWLICGGRELHGDVRIGGCKNAALPILFASLLTDGELVLHGIPEITDVAVALDILQGFGVRVAREGETCVLCAAGADRTPEAAPTARLRGSLYLLGALLGRRGEVRIGKVGGCDFGGRPVDMHLAAFRVLGARGAEGDGFSLSAPEGLRGGVIRLPFPSVGATINALLAAVKARGRTEIYGAAREPHVTDTVRFLRCCGARIAGEGGSHLSIEGVPTLHGCTYTITPDMIESGTYLAIGAACGGKVRVTHTAPEQLRLVCTVLRQMGAQVKQGKESILLSSRGTLRGCRLATAPYPGFPTDLQPPFGVLMALSQTGGCLQEGVWEQRFRYLAPLVAMGVHAVQRGSTVFFPGGDRLHGAEVTAPDLRAGAALMMAALCAEGETLLHGNGFLGRGYAHFTDRLLALGADLRQMPTA